MLATPLLLVLASCQVDPAARSTTEYLTKLQPLLQENSLLAERVLFQASAVYNGATRPDEVSDAWTTDIVPVAEHLHHQSTFVAAPAEWSATHANLVAIWGERANAYRSISEGLRTADQETWDSGRKLAETVKIREEEWFDMVNNTVAPMGFMLDAYP
ncbi:MAG: hypothetical protein KTR31_38610 [Myxococcales bacterium]|nr:hypothetical protein [Myxococcales bacterium]